MHPFKAACRVWRRAALVGAALCLAAPAYAQSRGELLYTTHCAACHSTQMHWREKKQVRDWPGLRAQVRYWQAQAMLAWSDDDIGLVARYLNDAYYHLAPEHLQSSRGALWTRIDP
jgi:mono/diheme cytochrome c family protein